VNILLEKLKTWIAAYPGWQENVTLYVDYLGCVPGCAGVYPQGVEVLARREDVLGGVKERRRLRAMVYRVAGQEEDFARDAAWWEDFCGWVAAQSAAGLAPRFGNTEDREFVQARGGRLVRMPSAGTGVYGVEIVAEYWTQMGD